MTVPRFTVLLASITCTCILTGCVSSVHPLYSEGETVFREELVGEYEFQVGMGRPAVWKVESIDDEAYRVTFPPGLLDEAESLWIMHVVELDDQLYIDLFPEADEGVPEADAEPPRHIIARLRFEEDMPVTTEMNSAWLEAYLKEHPDELAVEHMEGKMPLITSSTEVFQRFIIAHAEDGLFDDYAVEGTEPFKGEFAWQRHDP